MKSESIQSLAKAAKARLSNGYWKDFDTDDFFPRKPNRADFFLKEGNLDKIAQGEKLEIVREILRSDTEVVNPIRRLMDKDYFEGLSEERKQEYVLKVSRQYQQLKEICLKQVH